MTTSTPRDRVLVRPAGPMGAGYRLLTIALLALVTIIAFEAMAISTAMPAVARDLNAVRSYGLAFSFMLTAELLGIVLAGVWADRSGPLPSLFAGQVLMVAGSATAGLAPTFTVLLAGRLVAGLGAGLIVVALYVVIGRAYPDGLRPKVFSWISAAWVLPALIGPPIAGWLTSTWSWRWVFLIVLAPIAITFAVVSTQRDRITAGAPAGSGPAVGATATDGSGPAEHAASANSTVSADGTVSADVAGSTDVARSTDGAGMSGDRLAPADRSGHRHLALLGMGVALSAGAMQWGSAQLASAQALPLILTVLGLVGIAATAPRLVPAGTLLMSRGLPAVMMTRFLLTAAFNGTLTFIPLMLVNERHLSLTTAGIMLTVGALGWSFGSFLQGQHALHDRRSELVIAGGASLTVGILLLSAIAQFGWHYSLMGLANVLTGLGMGLAMSSTAVLSLALSPVRDHGRTSASLQVADVLGSVLGISVAGAVFAAMHTPHGSDIQVYVLIWMSLAVVASLCMVGGQRTKT